MGSWTELDATYPPGALTPGAAMVVALGHLAGARSIYADGETRRLAAWFPPSARGLVADADLQERAEHFLCDVPVDDYLAAARDTLNPQQLRCVVLNLLDVVLAEGHTPETHPRYVQIMNGLNAPIQLLQPYMLAILLKNDLSIFPQ